MGGRRLESCKSGRSDVHRRAGSRSVETLLEAPLGREVYARVRTLLEHAACGGFVASRLLQALYREKKEGHGHQRYIEKHEISVCSDCSDRPVCCEIKMLVIGTGTDVKSDGVGSHPDMYVLLLRDMHDADLTDEEFNLLAKLGVQTDGSKWVSLGSCRITLTLSKSVARSMKAKMQKATVSRRSLSPHGLGGLRCQWRSSSFSA
ncbi:Hypothetical protein, putative [Bodo saltans]|uniref:Uncharacterized protein n=1 Tax=Bodo saltans TaxID=75058 RepID=A0A0S4IYQ5_BODSA|nr:Hypothetical protein, putative [Bodo saltans]|eukprot:CUG10469.1 Hypothetical protein, putative [Bodo saltans]